MGELEVAEPRLFGNRTPESVIADAHERHGPFVARVCLFSGGNDSLAVAHRCREHYDELVWIDTHTAVPGVREFVERAAVWLDKPLRVYATEPGTYERLVLGGQTRAGRVVQPLGFPGPPAHTRCYVDLKERAIDAMLRDLKAGGLRGGDRSARVLAITGIRRGESQRRRNRADVTKRGALIFANPIADWSNVDLHRYRERAELIESDVAALLHRSGECNCGAYAAPGEREMLRSLWPEWYEQTIGRLETECRRRGVPNPTWGHGRADEPPGEAGELCSDCQLRLAS